MRALLGYTRCPGIAAAFAQWARYMKGEAGQMRLAV